MISSSWSYSFALLLAVGTAVACGDDEEPGDGGNGGTSGSSGSSGKGGTAGQSGSSGAAGKGGTAGQGGSAGSAGKGGTAGQGGTSGAAGDGGEGGVEGGAGPGGMGGEGGQGPVMCGDVTLLGATISETVGSGSEPAPMGGTIQDGTYVQVSREIFSPATPNSSTYSTTIFVNGNNFEVVGQSNARQSGTFSTASGILTFNSTCPAPGGSTQKPYSFLTTGGPTRLVLFTPADHRVETFELD